MAWETLRDIERERRELERDERSRPPVACPNDGTPLQEGQGGALSCPFDGYRWPEDGR